MCNERDVLLKFFFFLLISIHSIINTTKPLKWQPYVFWRPKIKKARKKGVIAVKKWLQAVIYLQGGRSTDGEFKMGGAISPVGSGASASHLAGMPPQLGKGKEKLSDALKSCNEILKELFSKKHSVIMIKYWTILY